VSRVFTRPLQPQGRADKAPTGFYVLIGLARKTMTNYGTKRPVMQMLSNQIFA
jgi:hypothetical protein